MLRKLVARFLPPTSFKEAVTFLQQALQEGYYDERATVVRACVRACVLFACLACVCVNVCFRCTCLPNVVRFAWRTKMCLACVRARSRPMWTSPQNNDKRLLGRLIVAARQKYVLRNYCWRTRACVRARAGRACVFGFFVPLQAWLAVAHQLDGSSSAVRTVPM